MTIQAQSSLSIIFPIFAVQIHPPIIHTHKDSATDRIAEADRQHTLPEKSGNAERCAKHHPDRGQVHVLDRMWEPDGGGDEEGKMQAERFGGPVLILRAEKHG